MDFLFLQRSDFCVFLFEPFQQMELVIYRGPANLLHQFNSVRFWRRSVLKTLITIRADSAEISWRVRTIFDSSMMCPSARRTFRPG